MVVDLSGVRPRDASLFGALAAAVSLVTLALAVSETLGYLTGLWAASTGNVVVWLMIALFGACIFYVDAQPEFDGTCDQCGQRFSANSGAERVDKYVSVEKTGAPKRITIGPVSFVGGVSQDERYYCSAQCAEADTITVPATVDGELISERLYAGPVEGEDAD